jgi:hypothetical protein
VLDREKSELRPVRRGGQPFAIFAISSFQKLLAEVNIVLLGKPRKNSGPYWVVCYSCNGPFIFVRFICRRGFAWIELFLMSAARDWYLQHLELVTIPPALIVGYIVALHFYSTATWMWTLPTASLVYRMYRYSTSASVLGGSIPAFKYFFDIQHIMPTYVNMSFTDPVRV